MLIDLHLHSTFSDGTLTPKELVLRGRALGISVLALTDHDTTAGLSEFQATCKRQGMACASGIELSAEFPGTLHILGYRIDFGDSEMEKTLARVQTGREERNSTMIRKLRDLGMDITMEEVQEEAGGDIVGRPHMARVLVKKGYAPDSRASFSRFLQKGAPAYTDRFRLSPSECIALIRKAGGVAVLAHPGQTSENIGDLKRILGRLKEEGLWGLECITPKHRAEQCVVYLSLAAEFSLFPTAGSDFHGLNSSVSMGISVADDFLPWARLGVRL
ncbi:MAG: PHP domain-containing protein [Synergistaceae bacterium]|nr:PHP domain-containing protein [Synergistaceae bacterium]